MWNWRNQPNRKGESFINSATWLGKLYFCGVLLVSLWMSTSIGVLFWTQCPWPMVAGGGVHWQCRCLLWILLAEGRGFGQAELADSFPVAEEHIRQKKKNFEAVFSVSRLDVNKWWTTALWKLLFCCLFLYILDVYLIFFLQYVQFPMRI